MAGSLILSCMPLPCFLCSAHKPIHYRQLNGKKKQLILIFHYAALCLGKLSVFFFKGHELSSYQYPNPDNEWKKLTCIVNCISLQHCCCCAIMLSSIARLLCAQSQFNFKPGFQWLMRIYSIGLYCTHHVVIMSSSCRRISPILHVFFNLVLVSKSVHSASYWLVTVTWNTYCTQPAQQQHLACCGTNRNLQTHANFILYSASCVQVFAYSNSNASTCTVVITLTCCISTSFTTVSRCLFCELLWTLAKGRA